MKSPITNQFKFIAAGCFMLITASSVMAKDIDLSGRVEQDMVRDAGRKPVEIINFAGVRAGDHVLDLLAGGGYYSELLSRAVGDKGKVVLQIPKAYLKYAEKPLKERLANHRLKNVTYLLSEVSDLKLGSEQFDSAFLVLGYHDMFNKSEGWDFNADSAMPQVLKSLKPDGKLLVVDHNTAKGKGVKETKSLHRIEAAFVKADLEKRGFRLVSHTDILANSIDDHSKGVFDK